MNHLPQLREVPQRVGSLSNRFGRRNASYRLHDCAYTKFGFHVLEMGDDRMPRNAQDMSDLPGGLTLGGPFEAFEFAG